VDEAGDARAIGRGAGPLARYGLVVATTAITLLPLFFLLRRLNEWDDVYLPAARTLMEGGDIYAPGKPYLYPPFAAMLAIPAGLLSPIISRLVWTLANMTAVAALATSAWRLSGGGTGADRRDWAVLALGLAAVGPYAVNTLGHGQTDLIIDALVASGCLAIARGGRASGAVLIGLGAAFKGPPLLFAAYFLARRRWLEAAVVAGVAVGVNLAPDLIHSAPGGGLWIERWVSRYVLHYQSLGASLGAWGSLLIYNQGLAGTLQRWVNSHVTWSAGLAMNTHRVAPAPLKVIAYGTMLAMLAATLWAAGRPSSRTDETGDEPSCFALECGAVMALMLLMSPMSGLAHFPALAVAALCVARLAIVGGSKSALAAIAVAALAAMMANKDLVGSSLYNVTLWAGSATIGAVALWAGCVVALARPATLGLATPKTGGGKLRAAEG
jgi:hypothetical protein